MGAHEGGRRTTNRVSSTGSSSSTPRIAGFSGGMSAAIGGERVEQVPLAVARPGRLPRQNNNDLDSATGRGANVERKKKTEIAD